MARLVIVMVIAVIGCWTPAAADPRKVKPLNELKMAGIHRQTKDYSCGAAALSILFKRYFDDDIEEMDILSDIVYRLSKEETLDSMMKGFSLYDLKLAAERLGYSAAGIRLTVESARNLSGPVILLLKDGEYNHFVVLRGITQDRAFITDPAKGHYRIQTRDLQRKWHGETLVVGREGFGLPKLHNLNHPLGNDVAPEQNTIRALRYTPLN